MSDYTDITAPRRTPFVLVGWGNPGPDYAQTCSIYYDTADPGEPYPYEGISLLQRRIMAMRLRYVADLVDPDVVWDI